MVFSRRLSAVLLVGLVAACENAKKDTPAADATAAVSSVPVAALDASLSPALDASVSPALDASLSPALDASPSPPALPTATATTGSASAPPPVQRRALDTSCTKDEDCVPAPGCCPAPCTELVINRSDLARAQEENARVCPRDRKCFSAGSCRGHEYLCVRKTCKLVYAETPDYRPRK